MGGFRLPTNRLPTISLSPPLSPFKYITFVDFSFVYKNYCLASTAYMHFCAQIKIFRNEVTFAYMYYCIYKYYS